MPTSASSSRKSAWSRRERTPPPRPRRSCGPSRKGRRWAASGRSLQPGARIDDGTAVLNFDNPFIEQHPGGTASEVATVYSLANTLAANLPEVKRIRIQVGGKDVTTIKGHIDLREPVTPNKELVKQTQGGG